MGYCRNQLTLYKTCFKLTKVVRTTNSFSVLLNIFERGKVLKETPHTSASPAWHKTYLLLQTVDFWSANAGSQEIQQVKKELTTRKLTAIKKLVLGMRAYFGDNYDWLASVKKYDPDDVFWCWRCVGNEGWAEMTGGTLFGPLCQTD